MMRKICKQCGIDKDTDFSFFIDHMTQDGFSDICKLCETGKNRTLQHDRTEKIYQTYLKWKDNLKELIDICEIFAYKVEDI